MAITNPEAIKFVNEEIRPLCEQARALKIKFLAAQVKWFAGINNNVPNDSSAVEDGRDLEGISRLTGTHVNNVMSNLTTVTTDINDQIISIPCVRSVNP